MADGYSQSRSPVRAIESAGHLVAENTLPRSWSEPGVREPGVGELAPTPTGTSIAAVDASGLACPECGSALRLQLAASGHGAVNATQGVAPLRPARAPDPMPDFDASIRDFKRDLICRALAENGGVMTRTAKALGLKYTTFVAMVHRLGVLDEPEPKTTD